MQCVIKKKVEWHNKELSKQQKAKNKNFFLTGEKQL